MTAAAGAAGLPGDLPSFPVHFNLADYLIDRHVAARPGKPAVRVGDASYTYADVDAMSRQVAGALAELGVQMERRVLIVLPDGIEFVAAWLGVLRAGAVFAMANTIMTAEDYLYYLDYTRAPVAIIHESVRDRFDQARRHARHLRALLVAGDPGTHLSLEHEMARASASTPSAPTHADDLAGWLFTSGSTGKPKAAVHFHQDFAFSIETYAARVLGMREDDVTVSVPKLFFGYATGTNLMFPFAAGGTTVLFPDRSTPEVLFAQIERHRPTVLTSVPTMINMMLQAREAMPAGARPPDLSSLRVVLSAGEALPGELYRRWKSAFGVEILDGIGSAEMFHIYISNRFGDVREDSLGRLVPGYEARIVGPDGHDVPAGDQGTLWIRGGSTALCYWQRRAASRAAFRGDWCVTGDQFRRTQDGYFYYCGRTDDMLKVSGIFVSPLEIEDCLLGHEAVREAAVVGEADADGLVKPKAYVALREGHVPSREMALSLKAHVKQRLAPYKYPRWVAFVEALPRSDRGKVLRTDLRGGVEALLTVPLSGEEGPGPGARGEMSNPAAGS